MVIEQLGYLVVDATDLAEWKRFATEFVGLEAIERDEGALLLKADRRAYRILVQPSDGDRLHAAGWEVADANAFQAVRDRVSAAGVAIVDAHPSLAAVRMVTEMFSFVDPAGNRGEIYWGPISDFRQMASPIGVSKFVTGDLGMGHVVLPAMNFDETRAFWIDVLGFGLSDILHSRRGETTARIHFLHCNPRQHSLALAEMANPTGCIHLMLEYPDIDEVGLALDRVQSCGVPLWRSLGRHVNDDMISFYVKCPGGFGLELGCGGMVVDWAKEKTVFETTRGSHWGHQRQPELAK